MMICNFETTRLFFDRGESMQYKKSKEERERERVCVDRRGEDRLRRGEVDETQVEMIQVSFFFNFFSAFNDNL